MTGRNVHRDIKSKQFQHLSENFKQWLETLGYKPHTVKLNYWNTQEFLAFLESSNINHLKDFKNEQTTNYLEYLQHRPNCMKGGSLKAGTINKHITTLRLLSKETASYLSKSEILALYKAANDETNLYSQRDTAMLSIYYGCGLRASEGAALNINDILFDKNLLYVRKGKGYRERYVPINKQVKAGLQEYIFNQRNDLLNNKKDEALLLGRRGERWSVHGIYGRLQLLKSQANNEALKQKSFGMHILRHSIATHLLQSGMKLEHISSFLGHKSLGTTQKYTHLAKEEGC